MAVRELHEAYRRRGVELRLYQLPGDTPCRVFAGIGVQVEGSGPSVVVGLGCDFSAAKAARQALMEVGQIRPAFRQKLRKGETLERLQQLLADPSKVEQLEDHDLLYAVPDKLSAFDFLFKQRVMDFDWEDTPEKGEKQKLDELISWCRQEKRNLIYCNLTPPDMQKMGLYTARVVITGFQPIHFGFEKKDDASSRVRFWTNPFPDPGYDIMYPSKGAAEYLVNLVAFDASDRPHFTNLFSDTIQSRIDFLNSSYYQVTLQDSLHFAISFPKTRPTLYTVSLKADNFLWDIRLPSTKNTFNGADKIIDLSKSIRLKGMNLSQIQPAGLHIENGDNMSYTDYYNFIFASDAAGNNRLHLWQWY